MNSPQISQITQMTGDDWCQGSEYDAVAIVVPRQGGRRLLTRRLLYTAMTRAMKRVVLVATESALRDAIG